MRTKISKIEQELRKKFIIISVGVMFLVLFIIAATINISNYIQIEQKANKIIDILSNNDGGFPPHEEPFKGMKEIGDRADAEMPFSTRYFTIIIQKEDGTAQIDLSHIYAVDKESVMEYCTAVLNKNKTTGFISSYKYVVIEKENEQLIIFVDLAGDILLSQNFLKASILVCVFALMVVFILVYLLSAKAVRPIVESYEKQSEFITNIIHELKTPLAIIQANTEVMELETAQNQWSQSNQNQIIKLNTLINRLVSQAKMEEANHYLLKTKFSLSELVEDVAQGFLSLEESKNKKILLEIQKGIIYEGEEQSIAMLISILIENALKYSDKEEIKVTLKRKRNKIIFVSENQVMGMEVGSYHKWFDRFYREDSARNSKEGSYGIGLSMAKTIVEKHDGKIKAESKIKNFIQIKVEL